MIKTFLVVLCLLLVCVKADVSIYTDSLLTPFQDWSYVAVKNAQDSTQKHSGSYSYSFQTAAWNAAYFEAAGAISTSLYSGIQFYVYIPAGGNTNLEVDIISGGSAVSPTHQLSTIIVGGSLTTGTWLQGYLDLSVFAAGTYDGVWWQDKSGTATSINVYLDDVKLISKTSSSAAATVATVTTAKSATTSSSVTTSTSTTTAKSTTTTGSSSGGGGTGPSDSTVLAYYTTGFASTHATYYGAYTNGGTCTLDPTPPVGSGSSIYTTVALYTTEFDNSETCGICLNVTYKGTGSGANPPPHNFIVYVNNLCPSCSDGGIDLGLNGDGQWDISWIAIACPGSYGNIQYLYQGSNDYYIKIQARNTKYPIYQFAIKQGSNFVNLVRQADNFFLAPSSGLTFPLSYPITVKLTAVNGEQVTDTINAYSNGVVIQGAAQFA